MGNRSRFPWARLYKESRERKAHFDSSLLWVSRSYGDAVLADLFERIRHESRLQKLLRKRIGKSK
jgi:hypothetical protein